ncbi:MAG: phenylacetate--CoA ligase family protein [Armatimonadetes bacterium]|nr:phenylacetate--CoA ligase family protein [Armatimonadota bacterium]
MTLGERVRGWAFWSCDWIRGGRVASHLRELELLRDDPELLEKRQAERLEKLLAHACQTTPYYRQFAGATALKDFPVLQKRTIREHHDDFLSSCYPRESLCQRKTSGSYGSPLTFYSTQDKAARHQAEVIYHALWAGYRIGARNAQTRTRQVKTPLRLWMQNQLIINPTHLTEEWLNAQRDLLRSRRIELLVGFPSAFAAIASYCKSAGDTPSDFSLGSVIAIAEPLREEAREVMETTFGCPVYSRYTTEEFGVLGQECPAAKQHHLNQATFLFELLDLDHDTPVPPGKPGRVVVTDLWSQAMPLIRYDLGDVAVMEERCACGWNGPVFTHIEGRLVETIFDAAGNRLSPFAINSRIQDLDSIIQFQFVQHAPARYSLRLHTMPSFSQEQELTRRLLDVLGLDAELKVDYVDEIPPLRSGKRPFIINEMELPGFIKVS